MKRLIASLLLFVTLTAGAEPFKLKFEKDKSDEMFVVYNEKDWELVGHQSNWGLYLSRGETDTIKGLKIMHTMIVYDEPVKSSMTNDMISRIFNAGLVDCDNERIFLLNDFFTDANHKVVWVNRYEYGEFIADVPPGTPRNSVYKLLCEGKNI